MKALITGASGGIGSAIARKFLACGYTVVGIDVLPAVISDENYTHILADVTGALPDVIHKLLLTKLLKHKLANHLKESWQMT